MPCGVVKSATLIFKGRQAVQHSYSKEGRPCNTHIQRKAGRATLIFKGRQAVRYTGYIFGSEPPRA